jgi:hypothetical protein
MFANEGLRYLVSGETLILFASFALWMRVWILPTPDRIKSAALSAAALVAFRAVALSITIVVTTR